MAEHIAAAERMTPAQAEFNRRLKAARQRIAEAGQKAAAAKTAAKQTAIAQKQSATFIPENSPPPAQIIQDFVCQYYGIDRAQMLSLNRSKYLSDPRSVAIYLMRSLLGLSTPRIGALFSNRDHTTILHAIKKITRRCARDTEFATKIDELRNRAAALLESRPTKWGRYVPYWKIPAYEQLGWLTQALHAPHSRYSALMVWLCDCPMREPG